MQIIAVVVKKLLAAIFASTKNSQMSKISLEAIFFHERLLQWYKQRLIQLQRSATPVTNQMMMVALVCIMIGDTTVSHVSDRH